MRKTIDRLLAPVLAAIGGAAFVLAIVSISSPPVEAQGTTPVRIVPDDVQFARLIQAVNKLTAAVTASAAVKTPVGRQPFTLPIGQVGDALKVFPLMTSFDPCFGPNKGDVAISQTASTRLVPGLPGMRIFVCAARVVAGAAEVPSFIEGTGTTCGTGTAAVAGSTTAANGESYAANGGFSGGDGIGTIMVTNVKGNDLCLQQSGANRLAGNLVYTYGQ